MDEEFLDAIECLYYSPAFRVVDYSVSRFAREKARVFLSAHGRNVVDCPIGFRFVNTGRLREEDLAVLKACEDEWCKSEKACVDHEWVFRKHSTGGGWKGIPVRAYMVDGCWSFIDLDYFVRRFCDARGAVIGTDDGNMIGEYGHSETDWSKQRVSTGIAYFSETYPPITVEVLMGSEFVTHVQIPRSMR